MAYAFVGSATSGNVGGGAGSVSYTATAGNTLLVYAADQTTGGSLTVSDGSNTYNFVGSCAVVNTVFGSLWWAHVTTGGALTISLSGTNCFGLYVAEYSGLQTSPLIASSFQSQVQVSPGVGANILTTSSNPNVTTAPAMLWGASFNGGALTGPGADAGPSLGNTLAYASRTVGWIGSSANQTALVEDVRILATGTNPITFGTVSGNQFDGFSTIAAAFAETVVNVPVGDGHTAAGTTVSTGTGGSGMNAVSSGQQIEVLFRAASATTQTCTCSDSLGNVYGAAIDHLDRTTLSSREWYKFTTTVTVAGTPVITCTYGASSQLDIAATILSGLATPALTAGQVASHFQSGASIGGSPANDLQSSGNTPVLASQPVLLAAWGYCDANGTPNYGTQFTGVGTAWSTLGSGTARLAFETEVYASTVPVSGRFTPIANQDAYTFVTAYNLPFTPQPLLGQILM